MKKFMLCAVLGAVVLGAWSCGSSSPTPAGGNGAGDKAAQNGAASSPASPGATPGAPAAPAVAADIQKAPEPSPGAGTGVLLYGGLSKNGSRQILAVNRMRGTPQAALPGTVIPRGVLLENI